MSAPAGPEPADPLLEGIRRLQTAFDAKIRYDETRERLMESMTEELNAHRHGTFQTQLRPVLFDLVTMYDDLTKMSEAPDCLPATTTTLLLFRDTVEQTLARHGVEVFTVDGPGVDRARQKVIHVVETTDPTADRQVAERLRPGFHWHDKVLRPEWVSVYVVTDIRAVVEEGASN